MFDPTGRTTIHKLAMKLGGKDPQRLRRQSPRALLDPSLVSDENPLKSELLEGSEQSFSFSVVSHQSAAFVV